MKKAELRKAALNQRKALSAAESIGLSQQLLTHFTRIDLSGVGLIHCFLPIRQKNEPDTFLIIDWLREHHPDIRIVVPKADFETAMMTHHFYHNPEDLELSPFNIPEPKGGEAHTGDVDLVLVPLLAFDAKGYRVGYGKGFYDRFLEGSAAQKIGLSFFSEPVIIDDVHENDIRLDQCITPAGLLDFPLY